MLSKIVAGLPPEDAIAYFAAKGYELPPTFDWRDMWQEAHTAAFTVAKSAGFDILGDVHSACLAALENGTPYNEFAKQLAPILQEKGWWGKKEMTDPVTGEAKEVQLGSPRRLNIITILTCVWHMLLGHGLASNGQKSIALICVLLLWTMAA